MRDWKVWFKEEQERRGWSLREVARQGEVDVAELSRALRGERPLTHYFAEGIARAFGVDAFFVKHMAGLESAKLVSDLHPAVVELARRIDTLPLTESEIVGIVQVLNAQVDLYLHLLRRVEGDAIPVLEALREVDPALADEVEARVNQKKRGT